MMALVAALAMAAAPAAGPQGGLTERQLADAGARPAAATTLPGALAFTSPDGRRRTLARLGGTAPLVLLFADFNCRHLCGPGLTLTAGALHDAGLRAGVDYRMVVIGLDPRDGPADAARFARRLHGLPDVASATTILRGDAATVAATAHALGYRYLYDAATDQFAHDASVYVFAADGHLAALLPETALRPAAMGAAVRGAASLHPASFGERVAHLCYGFASLTGRFDRPVVLLLQAFTALALLGGGACLLLRRGRAAA